MSARTRTSAAVVVALCLGSGALSAYLKLGTSAGNLVIGLKWTTPIRYSITARDVPGVTSDALAEAVARSFAAWKAVPTISIDPQFMGFTAAEPDSTDNASVIGFQFHPELDRTLGATTFQVDGLTGQLIESDIFLNAAFDWSVATNGQSGHFDVQSIATHEIGHFLGLSHSLLGETTLQDNGGRSVIAKQAVMFPIAYPSGTILDRTLKADDIAGITDLYSTGAIARTFGQITGRVTLGGAGLFGAHVLATNQSTGDAIGGFALDSSGTFVIGGLEPGYYVVRAEPLDDASIASFFDASTVVNVNFKPAFYARLVAAPPGGAGSGIEIKVQPK